MQNSSHFELYDQTKAELVYIELFNYLKDYETVRLIS